MRVVAQVFIKGAQHRHAGAQHVHWVGLARQKPQHFDHGTRQCAFRGNLLRKLYQLFPVGQLAVEQEVSDFFETRLLRHIMNVVAAVHQPRSGVDPANGRLARDHAR